MTALDGLQATLFASEPEVRQPILTKVDDRGRLWTIQYLQYPNPNGLKRVSVDRWSRTVYDRVPKPPPYGPRGADRITILEDSDGDGRADQFRDFLDGLNLATGVAFGHDGVYVLQVPYLLFYADKDRNDVPDGAPDVLLTGFGMEDAQSSANHLTWGPDGWLYGVNGSTTTCRIRDIEFQQGVWRYHPLRDEFELFCEGGGNTFGLTFDERGNLFYSTNGGPFVHAMQGAYYRKSFGKHGPLHNLYAYGFFEVVKRDQVPGGPPTGGTIYLGHTFPQQLRGMFIAGNFLGHTSSWWEVLPDESTFTAKYGGVLLNSHDAWFGATDMCTGPDGAMYISDFHDQRTAHPDPDASWDRSNGRIFRIAADNTQPVESFDVAVLSSDQLVELLAHPNGWYADRARVHLAARRDRTVIPQLYEMVQQTDDELVALQGVWAWHASEGLDDPTALSLLEHPSEFVRIWTIRLLGDRRSVSPQIAVVLARLAKQESSPVVRCQLAATARRLPVRDSLDITIGLLDALQHDSDVRAPWMIWWALETHAIDGLNRLVTEFAREAGWSTASRRMQVRLLIRRWAAEGREVAYQASLRLLNSAPIARRDSSFAALASGLSERAAELGEIEQGVLFEQFARVERAQGRTRQPVEPVTHQLADGVGDYWRDSPDDPQRIRVALLCEIDSAYNHLLTTVTKGCGVGEPRPAHLALLTEFGRPDCVQPLLSCLDKMSNDNTLSAIIQVLGRFGDDAVSERLLAAYPDLSTRLRSQVIDVLLRRSASTRAVLKRVAAGEIDKAGVSIQQLRSVSLHQDERLDAQVRDLWGRIGPGTAEEKLAVMRRFNNDLRAGSGNPLRGKPLFTKHCGNCHALFGEGNKIGPDLTTANRNDLAALLANIVDPSVVVRREYINYTVVTDDGRVLTVLLAEQDAGAVNLRDARNQRTRLRREEIGEIREADVSIMPERILEQISPRELRDLFAYLRLGGESP
jgi:putative membrane-bound dehydrogenase-like protein